MSTLFFFLAAFILSSVMRWFLAAHARWVQAGLWVGAMAGLMAPLFLGLGAEPVVRELVWPFAAGLALGERFASWLLRPARPKTPARTDASPPKTSPRRKP